MTIVHVKHYSCAFSVRLVDQTMSLKLQLLLLRYKKKLENIHEFILPQFTQISLVMMLGGTFDCCCLHIKLTVIVFLRSLQYYVNLGWLDYVGLHTQFDPSVFDFLFRTFIIVFFGRIMHDVIKMHGFSLQNGFLLKFGTRLALLMSVTLALSVTYCFHAVISSFSIVSQSWFIAQSHLSI